MTGLANPPHDIACNTLPCSFTRMGPPPHLRALAPLRRRATLVATVLDTHARLTDDSIALFDRAVGRLFRRAEAREEEAVLRNARAINDKVRLFAQLGDALLAAKTAGGDPLEAV